MLPGGGGNGGSSCRVTHFQLKRERVVEVSRLIASLFSHGRHANDEKAPGRNLRELVTELVEVNALGGKMEAESHPLNVDERAYRSCSNDRRVQEALLAFFILRSIELELQQTATEGPPPQKKRRLERNPLFRLPCSEAALGSYFHRFCLELFSVKVLPGVSLVDLIDRALPTTDQQRLNRFQLPPSFVHEFQARVNVGLILTQWERRRLVILHRPTQHTGDEHLGIVLTSVSRPGLTQLLTQALSEVAAAVQRPIANPAVSIFHTPDARAATQSSAVGAPSSGPVPPPPPPPPDGILIGPSGSTGDLATATAAATNSAMIRKYLEAPSIVETLTAKVNVTISDENSTHSGASHPSEEEDSDESLSLKTMLITPTVGDLLTRTQLIPSRLDQRFGPLRYCAFPNRDACTASRRCRNVHYRKLIQPHTDLSLGDCSYLDTCRHIFSCKFVHYAVDLSSEERNMVISSPLFRHRAVLLNQFDVLERSKESQRLLGICNGEDDNGAEDNVESWFEAGVIRSLDKAPVPPQWIRCDMRSLDLGIFRGLVSVVMADPPWDIRMDLPYGTMTDNEMRNLRVDLIQEEGLLFLWVTGRAMEIARDCMAAWGYRRVDELVWVKTNHLHRIIRTGRTGHWLNHSKEHCLIGIKGNPNINRHLDCDVIVSEVRETSRKPDEIYRIIERMCPDGLKLELFGRQHNLRQNWITLGNQLDGVSLETPQLIKAFKEHKKGMRQVRIEEAQRLAAAEAKKHLQPMNGPSYHNTPSLTPIAELGA